MSALSEYQQHLWDWRGAGRLPKSISYRLFELVEGGMTIAEAIDDIGISRGPLYQAAGDQLWERIKRMSAMNVMDRNRPKFTSQRQFEAIVDLMSKGLKDGEWAIPRPRRHGQHLVGKRHNYPVSR